MRIPRPVLLLLALFHPATLPASEPLFPETLSIDIPHLTSDPSVSYNYDIAYIRAPRPGDRENTQWPEIAHPPLLDPGADLVLLHPDGSEETLVEGGEDGSITDPFVSIDGQWIFYSHIRGLKGTSPHGTPPRQGADIHKIHLPTRKIVQLTRQRYTPNTGAADWSDGYRATEKDKTRIEYGVLNLGPCPLPNGRLVFVSNRNGFIPPKHPSPTLQLFVMDDDGRNVEQIGHLNIGMALHPVVLKDGRIVFSSLESQGLRNSILWGLWFINPDGTRWGPLISAFDTGDAPNAFHFQTQLSDGSIIAEEYYNQNNSGFGAYLKLPPAPSENSPAFGPANPRDPRNPPLRFGRHDNGKGKYYRLPFSPQGVESFTRFANNGEGLADPSVLGDRSSPAVGKFTHPSGAPDNHLLTVWSPGPVNHQNGIKYPVPDGGLYLIKEGQPIDEPAQMRLIKNDPAYNEQWPRAVVPYERIYGIKQPTPLKPLANDGSLSPHLPEGTPFGLVGASSLYKRESYPAGTLPEGSVTATFNRGRDPNGYEGLDPFNTSENGASLNWFNQGADAGRYSNADIHAIRILAMEPTTHRHRGAYPRDGRLFHSHAMERLRILGEIPVRKLVDGKQPLDPDGNPDTSFLARIPADTAFTFQTLNNKGMVLNMAQTWHQLRPGEIRNDCGGCHAHSQNPTPFTGTFASRSGQIFDLTKQTLLIAPPSNTDSAPAPFQAGNTPVKNVEYFRDVQPILKRSCVACHTSNNQEPAGNLDLGADDQLVDVPHTGKFPGTYHRLALDSEARFGHKPVIHNGTWRQSNASRYIRKFQSRRSLLIWKTHGARLDGWSNHDFPTAQTPGDPNTLLLKGERVENTQHNRDRSDLDYNDKPMPPLAAINGTYKTRDGRLIKVEPLTNEDRLTLVRWIDLGCPIDLDYDPTQPGRRGYGWMADDNRPILTLTRPVPGPNPPLHDITLGAHDYYSGLDPDSLTIVADFELNGLQPGTNLAPHFKSSGEGIWRLPLNTPLSNLPAANLEVSVRDRAGNITTINRTFAIP